ncbi:MAG: DNA polymerase III subunit delta' [Rubrivivax sp.]
MADAARRLPWLQPVLQQARAMTQAHALLLHGAAGDGLFDAAQAIAQSWLCEAEDDAVKPCGRCAACHLLQSGYHPDLFRLFPEALRQQLGAGDGGEAAESESSAKAAKRKPSRQIRIDEVRAAIDWVATTSARGRAKVVLIHPAEAMNLQSASALLKTLEEPPRGARLLLSAAQPAQLLPTVRSRCQVLRLPPPGADAARQWLAAQGLEQPEVLLAAASGRPLEAAALAAAGIDAARWQALPAAVLAGQGPGQAVAGWPAAQVLDALQKLCHDALALAVGAAPRFFPPPAWPGRPASAATLAAWSRELSRLARQIDHPWSEPLLIDALLLQARAAWRGRSAEASDTLAA